VPPRAERDSGEVHEDAQGKVPLESRLRCTALPSSTRGRDLLHVHALKQCTQPAKRSPWPRAPRPATPSPRKPSLAPSVHPTSMPVRLASSISAACAPASAAAAASCAAASSRSWISSSSSWWSKAYQT
jgi:hypothetical protein